MRGWPTFQTFLGGADSVSAAFVCIVCAWISGPAAPR